MHNSHRGSNSTSTGRNKNVRGAHCGAHPCLEGYGFHFENAVHKISNSYTHSMSVSEFCLRARSSETHVRTFTSGASLNRSAELLLSSSSYIGAPFYEEEGLCYSFRFQKIHLFCIPRRYFYSPRKVKQKH